MTVSFAPTTLGPRSGLLTFADDSSTGSQTVTLTGTGVLRASAALKVVFGNQLITTASSVRNIALTNPSAYPLTISNIAVTGDFVVKGTTGGTTLTSGSCSVQVAFLPMMLGARAGTLTFTDNAINSPQVVSLTGTGVTTGLASLTVSPVKPSIALGSSQQFTATGKRTNGTSLNLTSVVTWSTTNPAVASISSTGTAASFAQGSTTIAATLGTFQSSATLVVGPSALASLTVSPANATLVVGNTQQFTATGTYTDGTQQDITKSSAWSSSDSRIGAVNSSGLATAMATGKATITATAAGGIQGAATLTVTPAPILSRVPVRVCLVRAETSATLSCTLNSDVASGNGLAVIATSISGTALVNNALQDTQSNNYSVLAGPVNGGYGSLYFGYAKLTNALHAGDSITLNVAGQDSWGLLLYDIGPVQDTQADSGVAFENPNSGPAGSNNPATGVPGWWTGQTAATTGASDLCLSAIGVGSSNTGVGAPAPIPSFAADGGFFSLEMSQFYAASDPNYGTGGGLLTLYAEVPAGTKAQSHVVSYLGLTNTAPAALYCFREGNGAVRNPARVTGNFCSGSGSCTLNNVAAGNMLLVNAHTYWGVPTQPMTASDTQAETVVFDQLDGSVGLATWHVSPVANAGTHTITVNDTLDPTILISVAEISGQSAGNPVDALGQYSYNSSSLASAMLTTSVADDLLFGWGRSALGSDEAEGFTSIRVAPTVEYDVAPAAGPQTVSITPRGTPPWSVTGIQAMAIRESGSAQPPILSPHFTGNYCILIGGNACTINNVAPGNILIISSFVGGSLNQDPMPTDSQGEAIIVDRGRDSGGGITLSTWHIANVAVGGSHSISIDHANGIVVTEYSAQSAGNPIDAVGVASGANGAQAITSLQTTQGSDLIYAWCSAYGNTGWGDGFAALTTTPTSEYRLAASTQGIETASCPLGNSAQGWVIQELAIRH